METKKRYYAGKKKTKAKKKKGIALYCDGYKVNIQACGKSTPRKKKTVRKVITVPVD